MSDNMIKWVKPSGDTIETNDLPANVEAAEALGWKRDGGKAKPKAKPKAKD